MLSDKQIQKTNDFSSVSKHSMCAAGYMEDKFLEHVLAKKVRRAPIINRGYYVRMHAVDHVVYDFVQQIKAESAGRSRKPKANVSTMVVLGAGYDTLFFRLHDTYASWIHDCELHYLEIDFLDVCNNKSRMILSEPRMTNLLGTPAPTGAVMDGCTVVLHSQNYALVGFDLRTPEKLPELFNFLGLDCNTPTLILSEVVLTYIVDSVVKRILTVMPSIFPMCIFVNYEQVGPFDSYGRFMIQHFKQQGSPLLNLELYPTANSHIHRFKGCGWNAASSVRISEYWANHVTQEEKNVIQTLEPFDEYEEFLEKCNHYVLSLASSGNLSSLVQKYSGFDSNSEREPEVQTISVTFSPEPLFIYGHASAFVSLTTPSGESVVVAVAVGGVTKEGASQDQLKLRRFYVTENVFGIWIPSASLETSFRRPLVHHSLVPVPNNSNKLLVIGGHTSPDKPNLRIFLLDVRYNEESDVTVSVTTVYDCSSDMSLKVGQRCQAVCCDCKGRSFVVAFSKVSRPVFDPAIVIFPSVFFFRADTSYTDRYNHCIADFPSVTLWNSGIIVSGGLRDGKAVAEVRRYSPCGRNWVLLGMLQHCRFGHTSHVWKDKLIVIGGVSHLAGRLPDMTVLNIMTKQQMHFNFSYPTDEIVMLFNHTSLVIEKSSRIVIIGGGGNCFSFGTQFNQFPISFLLNIDATMMKDRNEAGSLDISTLQLE